MAEFAGTVVALAMLFASAVAALRLRKRRFDRTNEYGVERFPHFRAAMANRFVDGILWFAAIAFAVTGVLLLAFLNLDSWGWVIVAPFALWALVGFAF